MKGRTKEAEVFNNYLEAIKLRANKMYNELLATNAPIELGRGKKTPLNL